MNVAHVSRPLPIAPCADVRFMLNMRTSNADHVVGVIRVVTERERRRHNDANRVVRP